MPRFFTPKENVKGNLIYIEGREARHITNVMRLKEEDKVIVFDGTGKEYSGFIKEVKPKSVIVEVISTKTAKVEALPEITLAQSMPKKDKMDYIVEKATELGARRIIPIISERTIIKLEEEKSSDRVDRWKRIAVAAAKQCGRRDVTEIEPIQKFYNVIDRTSEFDLTIMACLAENTWSLKKALAEFNAGKILLFIGPEGDFTPEEIKMAEDESACKFVSLGKRVLKSDTAAIFALSVLNHELSL